MKQDISTTPAWLKAKANFGSDSGEIGRLLRSYQSARAEMDRRWCLVTANCPHPESRAEYETYCTTDTLGNTKDQIHKIRCGVCLRTLVEERMGELSRPWA
jgi:hypothetical protein